MIPQTVDSQTFLSMGFSRQECWSELKWLLPGDLPNPGIELVSHIWLYWQTGSLLLAPPGKPPFDTEEDSIAQVAAGNFPVLKLRKAVER